MNSSQYLRIFVFFVAISYLILLNCYRTEAGWETMTVDSTVSSFYSSIALDSSGNPHISYSAAGLKYAYFNGSSWEIETVDSTGRDTSIALDSSGNPHIAYNDSTNDDVKYAYFNGSWQIQTVYSVVTVGRHIPLALDSNDNPHIAFFSCTTDPIYLCFSFYYVFYNGSSWEVESFHPWYHTHSFPADDLALALDSYNTPHFSYCNGAADPYNLSWVPESLGYAYYDGSWHDQRIHMGRVGEHVSLAIDSGNQPHFSYYDSTNNALRYHGVVGGGGVVDSNGNVGWYTSLALDSNNMPHISYYDITNQDLKYAYYDGMDWHIEVVDSTGSVGRYSSIALDSNDIPHISYYDYSNYDLKYAHQYCEGTDTDCDGIVNEADNCPGNKNPHQEDTFPPQGNGIGDACDCECDFDCSGGVDADDVTDFLGDFGRSTFNNPCTNASPCNGDVNCDVNVDADDVTMFLEDFGRSQFNNPCPTCVAGDWCVY